MKFTLIGSGTSTGIPMPGCRCRVCLSENPKNKRNRTSALIELRPDFNLLIDASPDLRHQSVQFDIRQVNAVLYTHCHADHILGTDDLRSFNFVHHHRIPCYGTELTLRGLRSTFSYIFEPDPNYQGGLLAQLDLMTITNDDPFEIAGVNFEPFVLAHGKLPVTGFRVGSLGYATDCKVLSPRAKEILYGVDTLFLDALRYEEHATHMTVPQAIETAAELKAKKTYLIHLAHSIDHEEVSAMLPSNVELGFDGLTVEF